MKDVIDNFARALLARANEAEILQAATDLHALFVSLDDRIKALELRQRPESYTDGETKSAGGGGPGMERSGTLTAVPQSVPQAGQQFVRRPQGNSPNTIT